MSSVRAGEPTNARQSFQERISMTLPHVIATGLEASREQPPTKTSGGDDITRPNLPPPQLIATRMDEHYDMKNASEYERHGRRKKGPTNLTTGVSLEQIITERTETDNRCLGRSFQVSSLHTIRSRIEIAETRTAPYRTTSK